VYEDEDAHAFVAYDRFVSLIAQYRREEMTQAAQVVEGKLEAFVAAVTGATEAAEAAEAAEVIGADART